MSSPDKRRQERERGRKKTDSARKKLATKGQGWIAIGQCMLPSRKADKYPEKIEDLRAQDPVTRGFIHEHTLHALVATTNGIEFSEHLPQRADSTYLHPETMQCCGFAIAQPVAVWNPVKKALVVCKPWPVAKMDVDAVALSPSALQSASVSVGSLVEVRRIPRPSSLPVAREILLQSRCEVDFPLSESFKNYLLRTHEGHYVCRGNHIALQFYGERREFTVEEVLVSDEDSASRLTDSALEDASIAQSMSLLSVQEDTPNKTPQKSSGVAHGVPATSTPVTCAGMELDTCAGTDLELESDLQSQDGGSKDESILDDSTVEQKIGNTVSFDIPVPVYRITTKTKIRFIESQPEKSYQPGLSNIGGLQRQIQLLRELVLYPLETPEATQCKGLQFPRGVLLFGPAGVGKSLLAQALAAETSAHSVHVSATEAMVSLQESESKLEQVFKEAREHAPSIVVIEDLDVLCPHRELTPSESERRSTAAVASLLDQLKKTPPSGHVVVMATTNQIERVEPGLRRPGRFDKEVEIPVPSAAERREILSLLLRGTVHSLSEEDLTRLADAAHGHVGADLYAVCAEAQHKALRRSLESGGGWEGVRVCCEDVRRALREVRPSAMREVTLEVPKVLWSDIGGQEDIKQKLREAVEWPLKHPEAFARLGISPPRGVLLYGPPGCSKTMIARALATESGLNFIAVKGPELFSKWVGDSERAVRQVFSRARAAAPAIVFFDEIDALAVQRKSEGSAVADRVLAQLLTEMDGVEALREVLVVAATNRPDLIDKALLRPGRIDRIIYVPLPSPNTRREILKLQFQRTPVAADVALETLVTSTEGFSGAEVVSLCQEAALCAMHEDIGAQSVAQRHFRAALGSVSPQTDSTTIAFYQNYHHKSVGVK